VLVKTAIPMVWPGILQRNPIVLKAQITQP